MSGQALGVPLSVESARQDAVADAVDADELVDLLRAAVRIPSVTPDEADFARWTAAELADTTTDGSPWASVRLEECAPRRPNVYATASAGVRANAGAPTSADASADHHTDAIGGRSLLLAGHLDTVAVDDWVEHHSGTEYADPFAAHVRGGEIWGRGVTDQKAGICALIEAMRAVRRAGFEPAANVTATLVCDEESGQPASGTSAGMRSAANDFIRGLDPLPEFAIYTEPTTSAVYTAQMGFLIADIALLGESAYFGRPELGNDALKAGAALLEELWTHSDDLRRRPAHELLGEAFLLVTSVRSGGNIAVPGRFDASLIRKILPGEDLDEAAAAIRAIGESVASRCGVKVEVSFSAPRDHRVGGTPNETPVDHLGVVALCRAIEREANTEARIEGAPYWSETSFLRELGVPAVYFSPGDISCCHTPFERIDITELVMATRALARFIADWCGLAPLSQLSSRSIAGSSSQTPARAATSATHRFQS